MAYVTFWSGTSTEYSNIATKSDDMLYFIQNSDNLNNKIYKGSKVISDLGTGIYLPLAGGNMTGEIKLAQGDGYGIQLGTNGRINATANGSTSATVSGINGTSYLCGHSSFALTMRGSGNNPTFNGTAIPLANGTGASGTWSISINGNAKTATSATSATKATQDGSGNTITSTYETITHAETTYVPYGGGRMTGPFSFQDSSLPQRTGFQFLVGIDAFADGGTMCWSNVSDVTVGRATNATQADNATRADRALKIETYKSPDKTSSYANQWQVCAYWESGSGPIRLASDQNQSTYKVVVDLADVATKATQDGSGNTITSTYCTLATAQTISGTKTFSQPIGITSAAKMQYNSTEECIEFIFT